MSGDELDKGLSQIELEYEEAFWKAGVARRVLASIDETLYSIKLQRRAAEQAVRAAEHAFADFIVAHPEIKEINERRRAMKQEFAP